MMLSLVEGIVFKRWSFIHLFGIHSLCFGGLRLNRLRDCFSLRKRLEGRRFGDGFDVNICFLNLKLFNDNLFNYLLGGRFDSVFNFIQRLRSEFLLLDHMRGGERTWHSSCRNSTHGHSPSGRSDVSSWHVHGQWRSRLLWDHLWNLLGGRLHLSSLGFRWSLALHKLKEIKSTFWELLATLCKSF